MENRFKELRMEKGLSQEQLGDLLGISQQAINKYERGTAIPGIKRQEKMCEIFHCNLEYLLGKSDIRVSPDNKNEILNAGENRLVAYYRSMSSVDQKRLLNIAEMLTDTMKKRI